MASLRSSRSIAIPASIVSDVPHLREKTNKIGLIGRAAAIFRVDEIIIFPDLPSANQKKEAQLIAMILSYLETPQYLRKSLFKIRPELRFVGILPPLRTPHHPVANRIKKLRIGETREGIVLSSNDEGSRVNIGVERSVLVSNMKILPNTRITVRLMKLGNHPQATVISPGEIEAYWGYRVVIASDTLGKIVKNHPFDLVIATSRHGSALTKVRRKMRALYTKADKTLVMFGSPTRGLDEIVASEKISLNEVAHLTVNTIPNQGTQTVRTEEAVYASLAIINTLQ